MLMASLQRVVNGGGRIERGYGLGRGALDLMISTSWGLIWAHVRMGRGYWANAGQS